MPGVVVNTMLSGILSRPSILYNSYKYIEGPTSFRVRVLRSPFGAKRVYQFITKL